MIIDSFETVSQEETEMVRKMSLMVGAFVVMTSVSNLAQAQYYRSPVVVSSPYRVSAYRSNMYVAPVYRAPITVYRTPVYRTPVYRVPVYRVPVAPVYRSGVNIGIGIGGPSYYGRGFGYPGYGFGTYGF